MGANIVNSGLSIFQNTFKNTDGLVQFAIERVLFFKMLKVKKNMA